MNNKSPVWKLRQGSLSAAAWQRQIKLPDGTEKPTLAVTIDRRYKGSDGAWASSNSFTLNELHALQTLVRHAIDRVLGDRVTGESEAGEVQ